jgi:hypothetical protein
MANTAREMSPAIGTVVIVRCESLEVSCIVIDVKNSYGRERLLIKPVAGEGTQWIEMSRVIRVTHGRTEVSLAPR